MNQLNALHRMNELLALFVLQVKGPSSSGLYDINVVAEQVLIPVFSDGKYPITIRCAREVGKIMKYSGEAYRTKYRLHL